MKLLAIALAVALATILPATAHAATADAAFDGPPEACDVVDCEWVIDIVRCVGDALGGHACHAEASLSVATPDPAEVISCVKAAARNILDGVTPEPCAV